MTKPPEHDAAVLEHLEHALEVSCGALVGLELIRGAQGTTHLARVQHQVRQAIESVRAAIAGLRLAHEGEPSPLAFGFVQRPEPAELVDAAPGTG